MMKRTLVGMFVLLIIFTMYHSYMFYKTGSEPSTLISCVFVACSVEAGSLMVKKIREARDYDNTRNIDGSSSSTDSECSTSEHYYRDGQGYLPTQRGGDRSSGSGTESSDTEY